MANQEVDLQSLVSEVTVSNNNDTTNSTPNFSSNIPSSNTKKVFKYTNIPSSSRLKRSKDDNLDTYLPSNFFLETSIPPSILENVPTSIVVLDWKSQFQLETKYKVKELLASQKHRRCMSLTTTSPSQQKKNNLHSLSEANSTNTSPPTNDNISKEQSKEPNSNPISQNQTHALLQSSSSDDKNLSLPSYAEFEVQYLKQSYEDTLKVIRSSQTSDFYENFVLPKSISDSNLTANLRSNETLDSIQFGESISNQIIPNVQASDAKSSSSSKAAKKKAIKLSKQDQYSHSDSSLTKTQKGQKKKHGILHVFSKLGRKKSSSSSLTQQLQEVNAKITKDPNNLHLYLERARIHVQMGNIELAKHDYDVIQHPSPDMVVRTNNN